MRHITLKSVVLGWVLSAASLLVDCGSQTHTRAGVAGANGGTDAGLSGQGGGSANPSESGAGTLPRSSGGQAGAGGDPANIGGVAGEAADASLGSFGQEAGTEPDARPDDARADSAEGQAGADSSAGSGGSPSQGGTGGSTSQSGTGGTGGSTSQGGTGGAVSDAGLPPVDCGADAPAPAPGDGGAPTLAHVQAILDTYCVYCHHPVGAPKDLDLSNVALVVGTHSEECTSKLRIQAGSAENSYLVDKLLHRSQSPCGCIMGQQMPLDDSPLGADDLATIRDWINGGAQ